MDRDKFPSSGQRPRGIDGKLAPGRTAARRPQNAPFHRIGRGTLRKWHSRTATGPEQRHRHPEDQHAATRGPQQRCGAHARPKNRAAKASNTFWL